MTEPIKTVGARPVGTNDPESASAAVREMFNNISPRYDLLNHLLSMNIDRMWWWRTARRFRHILRRNEAEVLDLCCGTGDMAFALYRQTKGSRAEITGADFAREMLALAERKGKGTRIRWTEADAMRMPFGEGSFDLVTSAFGFRNLVDYDGGLREIVRVLRPNGEVGILECGVPKGRLGQLYLYYFREVLPRVGTLISGVNGAYAYLPASVERFPAPPEMLERMRAAGFREAEYTPYTFGVAGLYWGRK